MGFLFNVTIAAQIRKIKRAFLPLFKRRLETLRWSRDDLSHEEPHDHLQMMMRFAERQRPECLRDEDDMTRRIVVSNFGSMHQTHLQSTNLILNILATDSEFNTVSVLREEIDRVLGSGSVS